MIHMCDYTCIKVTSTCSTYIHAQSSTTRIKLAECRGESEQAESMQWMVTVKAQCVHNSVTACEGESKRALCMYQHQCYQWCLTLEPLASLLITEEFMDELQLHFDK